MSLDEAIAEKLNGMLDSISSKGLGFPDAERGLAVGGPGRPRIVLTIEIVSKLAAEAAEKHARENRE